MFRSEDYPKTQQGASYVLQRMYSFEVVELDWSKELWAHVLGVVKVGWYLGYAAKVMSVLI